jgi:hypothetical protein
MPLQRLRFALAFILAPAGLSGLLCVSCMVSGDSTSSCLWAFVPMLAVTLGHSLFFGVPVALNPRFKQSITLRKTLLAGALIGSVPITLLLACVQLASSQHDWYRLNDTMLEVHGHLTVAGWLVRLAMSIALALCGAVGAAIWWVVAVGHRLTIVGGVREAR